MPQERESTYPVVTAADWEKAREGLPRGVQAARLIAGKAVTGIPNRPYLLGGSDHAPLLVGIATFAEMVYKLIDALDDYEGDMPATVEDAASDLTGLMEDFR